MNPFFIQVKDVVKILTGKTLAARSAMHIFPSDVFITSYPKSGNTWMRFIIANLLYSDSKIDLTNIENTIPDIHKKSDYKLLKVAKPRFLKSHQAFNPEYPKIIYIVRDIRSIAVSYYHYKTRQEPSYSHLSHHNFTKLLLNGKLNKFGSWNENVGSWLAAIGDNKEKFLLVKYEDLLGNGVETVKEIVNFINLDRSIEEIKIALEKSEMKNLKKMEQKQRNDWEENKRASNSTPFFRSGSKNEWKKELDKQTINFIEDQCGYLMQKLGYKI